MSADQIFLAWLAGFFDGEGCVLGSGHREGRGYYTCLFTTITQQDKRPLLLIKGIFGGNVTPDKTAASGPRKNGKKMVWRWKATGAEAMAFLRAIRPYVRVKRDQVDLALSWPDAGVHYYSHNPIPVAVQKKRLVIIAGLQALKRHGKTEVRP